jgi:FkbM family methyltransferase
VPGDVRFRHLRTDEEIARSAPLSQSVARVAREAWAMALAAARAGRGTSRVRAPYWVLRYFLGFAWRPLRSRRLVTLTVRPPLSPRDVTVRVRRTQSDLFVFQNVLLRGVYAFPYERIEPRVRTIVDLGANTGVASRYLWSRFPEARLVCVEPTAESVVVLQHNREHSWSIVTAAVSDADGECEFGTSEWWGSGSIVTSIWRARQGQRHRLESRLAMPSRVVPAVSLPTLFRDHGLDRVDLLKMDIEGAEAAVFAGDVSWLDQVRIIAIEIHDKYVDGAAVRRRLTESGFVRWFGGGAGESTEVYARRAD